MSDLLSLCPGCFEEDFPSRGQPCSSCGWSSDENRPPLALPLQTELKGRYVAGRILGEPGGFGVTYLVYDQLQSEKVAIKEYMPREIAGRDTDGRSVVPHSNQESEEFEYGKEQFLGEAQTLAQFDHANIVQVRDFFEANGTAYLVMEYYEGKTLDAYLEELPDGKMDPEAAKEVMLRVLDGLKEVHSEGYLHRDLKPENVYLTEEGRPILIDFGAAREAMGERSRSLSVVMTPGYAPYEQYSREGNQGPHTDVYGAGATLYRMVTGEKPPPATDRVIEDTLEDPREIRPEVPAELSKAIMNALRMGDQERTPDAGVLQEQLKHIAHGVRSTDETSFSEFDEGVESGPADVKDDVASQGHNTPKGYTTKGGKNRVKEKIKNMRGFVTEISLWLGPLICISSIYFAPLPVATLSIEEILQKPWGFVYFFSLVSSMLVISGNVIFEYLSYGSYYINMLSSLIPLSLSSLVIYYIDFIASNTSPGDMIPIELAFTILGGSIVWLVVSLYQLYYTSSLYYTEYSSIGKIFVNTLKYLFPVSIVYAISFLIFVVLE